MTRWSLVAVVILWGANTTARAAPLQPVAIVAVESTTRLREDLVFIGSLAGQPRLAETIEAALTKRTKVAALAGWDESRPWGVFLWTDGLAVFPAACAPVKDLATFLAALEPLIGSAEQLADGVHKIGRGSATGYIARRGDWAWLVQTPERLDGLPDPAAILSALTRSHVAALEIHPRRIPEAVLAMPFDRGREEIAARMTLRPGETAGQLAVRRDAALAWLGEAARLTMHTDRVSLGLAVDRVAKRGIVEARWQPVAGSAAAQRLDAWRRPALLSRNNSGANAIARFDACLPLSDADRRQALAGVKELRAGVGRLVANWPAAMTDRQRDLSSQLLESACAAVETQAADGRIELSATLTSSNPTTDTAEATYALDMCGRLGDERACEQCRERLIAWATADDGILRARPNGMANTWELDQRQLTQLAPWGDGLWGPRPGMRVARDGATLSLALGTLSAPLKLRAGDAGGATGHVEMELRLAPLCQLAADTGASQLATLAAGLLKGQDDRLAWRLAPDDAALTGRLEIGGGIIRAMALAIALGAR